MTWEQSRLIHNGNLPLQVITGLLRKMLMFEPYLESLTVTRITLGLKSGRHLKKYSRKKKIAFLE